MIRCSTYNVLANSMASPEFFDVPDANVLKLESRMPLLLRSLEKLTDRREIILLQEVDIKLAGNGLHQFFSQNNYYPLTAHYSTKPNSDSFGNWIVFPRDLYDLVSYGQERIGLSIPTPTDEHCLIESAQPVYKCRPVMETGAYKSQSPKSNNNVYVESQRRDSTLLYCVLRTKSQHEFCVFNYHMPCAYWWPAVMTLHADTLLTRVRKLSHGLPFILAGDFNTIPNTPIYNYLTRLQLVGHDGQLDPSYYPSHHWKPNPDNMAVLDTRVQCGHFFIPTTQCRNRNGIWFRETIDYIFCGNGEHNTWTVKEFDQDQPNDDMPNTNQGSDHLPISCLLDLG